jgi:hypothetical protein
MNANRAIAASKVLHCSNVSESAVQELLSFMVAFGKVAFGEQEKRQRRKRPHMHIGHTHAAQSTRGCGLHFN